MRHIPAVLGLLAWVLFACGSDEGTGSKVQADGGLYIQFVHPSMKLWVTVVSINDEPPQEKDLPQGMFPQQEVEVALDEITPVTAVLSGGAEVRLNLRVSRTRMKEFDLTVTIDGSQLIYITEMNPYEEGLAGLKYEVRSYG